ncbi:hypothetical protein BGZ61DRAFT_552860 [Ilyonectria robusta]|uniref:uncharacterized protein n=1 Tax=Ilyonectria robusta TaxID=1079257 RepID=UPI001E8D954E|nr:uncharacterized protein BGZ61DRAFT_552860 [Ilyonectria robusta]KAH8735425.1 hypothetical protein BGZ61DRAFT_552860 [Ilyonectria robusta]
MDPSSGPPRPALQPPAAEDPPITAAHLARFEFSDAGTKILMVEWYPGAVVEKSAAAAVSAEAPDSAPAADFHDVSAPAPAPGSDAHPGAALAGTTKATGDASASRRLASTSSSSNWEVSWPGKTTVLRAADADSDSPPASSSSLVDHNSTRRRVYFLLPPEAPVPATITLTPPAGDPRSSLTLKPLPAIFPPGFDAEAGIRGVLHTIWARRRLAALDREMADELRANAESVGLEMALAEKQWIQDTFLKAPPRHSPVSSRSPVASRLGDKLRGLKLATSPADLTPSLSANTFTAAGSQSHTLSPQGADIAVSSFSAMTSNAPTGPLSLNAALRGDITAAVSAPVRLDRQDPEDDLFALPLSPRSPDMKKSPFSAL